MYRIHEPESNIERIFDFYDRNYKKLKKIFLLTFGSILLLLISRLAIWAVERYTFNRDLNRTVNQISQLIDNVRTTYAVHTTTKTDIMKLMAQSNTMPNFLVQDGKLINIYGGTIAVSSSKPIMRGEQPLPTFKIAYQGLTKDVCMALSYLDWGGEESGLLAVALGSIDDEGVDTALRDIEEDFDDEAVEIVIPGGRKKWVKLPKNIKMNVAKPDDAMNPTPFSETLAEDGCNCGNQRSCSFALRYYTYVR